MNWKKLLLGLWRGVCVRGGTSFQCWRRYRHRVGIPRRLPVSLLRISVRLSIPLLRILRPVSICGPIVLLVQRPPHLP